MTTKIYSIPQLEAVFVNSKRRFWRVKDGARTIAENTLESYEGEEADGTAWNDFLVQMEAHPHGQYAMYVLTKDKAERNALKYNFIWGEQPQLGGTGRQERQNQPQQPLSTDFIFRLQDKLDAERDKLTTTLNTEREKHQREIESVRNHYRQELSDERHRREQAETQLSNMRMKQTIDDHVNAAMSKIRPKTVKPKRDEIIMNRVLGIAEKGAAIAGHHFGLPMGSLGISGTGDETEDEEEEVQADIGVEFLKRQFPDRTPENAIKMLDYLMTTEKGQEFKDMIALMP